MRVGIDATWAAALGTGTASYTAGLVRALAHQKQLDLVLYFQSGDEQRNPLYGLAAPGIESRSVNGWGQPGRTLLSLTRAAARDRLDIFHSPGYFLPLWPGPKVVTFHDVNMFLQWDTWWRPGMRSSWLSLCAQTALSSRLARRVLADSGEAARSISRVLRLPQARLSVLYPGIDDLYFDPPPDDVAARLRERHDLLEYLLFVSVLSPQKNLEGLLRAYSLVRRPNLKLALVGREDGPYFRQNIQPLIHQLGLETAVKVLGVVPPEALPGLYAGARVFLYPSFAEGFGLPPLEAMASGTPVIASNTSSLPEVLGDAALLVDPRDVEGIAEAMGRVLSDTQLRAGLAARGKERAARFHWDETARKATEIYATAA